MNSNQEKSATHAGINQNPSTEWMEAALSLDQQKPLKMFEVVDARAGQLKDKERQKNILSLDKQYRITKQLIDQVQGLKYQRELPLKNAREAIHLLSMDKLQLIDGSNLDEHATRFGISKDDLAQLVQNRIQRINRGREAAWKELNQFPLSVMRNMTEYELRPHAERLDIPLDEMRTLWARKLNIKERACGNLRNAISRQTLPQLTNITRRPLLLDYARQFKIRFEDIKEVVQQVRKNKARNALPNSLHELDRWTDDNTIRLSNTYSISHQDTQKLIEEKRKVLMLKELKDLLQSWDPFASNSTPPDEARLKTLLKALSLKEPELLLTPRPGEIEEQFELRKVEVAILSAPPLGEAAGKWCRSLASTYEAMERDAMIEVQKHPKGTTEFDEATYKLRGIKAFSVVCNRVDDMDRSQDGKEKIATFMNRLLTAIPNNSELEESILRAAIVTVGACIDRIRDGFAIIESTEAFYRTEDHQHSTIQMLDLCTTEFLKEFIDKVTDLHRAFLDNTDEGVETRRFFARAVSSAFPELLGNQQMNYDFAAQTHPDDEGHAKAAAIELHAGNKDNAIKKLELLSVVQSNQTAILRQRAEERLTVLDEFLLGNREEGKGSQSVSGFSKAWLIHLEQKYPLELMDAQEECRETIGEHLEALETLKDKKGELKRQKVPDTDLATLTQKIEKKETAITKAYQNIESDAQAIVTRNIRTAASMIKEAGLDKRDKLGKPTYDLMLYGHTKLDKDYACTIVAFNDELTLLAKENANPKIFIAVKSNKLMEALKEHDQGKGAENTLQVKQKFRMTFETAANSTKRMIAYAGIGNNLLPHKKNQQKQSKSNTLK